MEKKSTHNKPFEPAAALSTRRLLPFAGFSSLQTPRRTACSTRLSTLRLSGALALSDKRIKKPIFKLSRVSGAPLDDSDLLAELCRVAQSMNADICITDIARHKDVDRTDYVIQNWLRNRITIEFLGIWEQLNKPDFKPIEFDGFKKSWAQQYSYRRDQLMLCTRYHEKMLNCNPCRTH